MEINSIEIPIKINVVIQTYNRPQELHKCIDSLLKSDYSNIDLKIFIYDNNSDVSPLEIIKKFKNISNKIFLYRHKKNIGGDPNTWFAIEDQIKKNSDYISFISDDDYVLPNYFNEMKNFLNIKNDIVLNHSSIVHNHNRNLFEIRSLPTRKLNLSIKKNNKFIGMVDSKVFSSFTINTKLAKKSFNAFKNYFPNQKYLKYRYPLCALSSFTNEYIFINTPTYIHAFENTTFWGEINYYQDFFINRIEMFNDCHLLGAYDLEMRNSLIIDFLSGQKLTFLISLFLKNRKTIKPFNVLQINKLILRLFISKISYIIRTIGKIFIKIDNLLFKAIGPY